MWIGILILVFGLIIYPLIFAGPITWGKYDKDIEDICPIIKKQNQPRFSENGEIYFPSKHSLTLIVLIWLILLLSLVNAALNAQLNTLFVILITCVMTLWLESTTGYTLTATNLVIKFAFFSREIDLASLQKVNRSTNPLSAPAWSLKRLEITSTQGLLLLISPVEEEFFLKTLKERLPHLIIKC